MVHHELKVHNSCLLAGPSLTPKMMEVLIRFCWYQVALAADIEKAFLMVSVAAYERDCLKFLLFEDILADNNSISTGKGGGGVVYHPEFFFCL